MVDYQTIGVLIAAIGLVVGVISSVLMSRRARAYVKLLFSGILLLRAQAIVIDTHCDSIGQYMRKGWTPGRPFGERGGTGEPPFYMLPLA